MRLHRFSSFGFCALTLGFVVGCAGGQTGDLSGQNDPGKSGPETGDFGGCEEHRDKTSFDTQAASAEVDQLLAYVEQSFDAPITWKTAGEGQAWSLAPELGKGQLHIEVTRGAHAYELSYTPKQDQSDVGGISTCPPSTLGVDAHIEVTTDGGALAESFDTIVRVAGPGVATFSLPLDLSKLRGSLKASSESNQAKLVQVGLDGTLTADGTTGTISGIEQTDLGEVSSASRALLAVWPASVACAAASKDGDGLALPLDKPVLGARGSETLTSLSLGAPADIEWLDGSKTKLTIGIESAGDGCLRVREAPLPLDAGPAASYPVRVTLKSDDGRLDGAYDGRVVASGSGDQRAVELSASLDMAVADAAQSGFMSVMAPAGSETLSVSVKAHRNAASAWGSVDLFAMSSPACDVTPPMSTPGSGSSSPGCASESETRLENATWDY